MRSPSAYASRAPPKRLDPAEDRCLVWLALSPTPISRQVNVSPPSSVQSSLTRDWPLRLCLVIGTPSTSLAMKNSRTGSAGGGIGEART